MSSPDGPYQSQVLNLLTQQVRNLRDRSQQALNQLKLTTGLGIQLALYPAYVLFQTHRLATLQLRHTTKKARFRLSSAAANILGRSQAQSTSSDTPVCNVLKALTLQQHPSAQPTHPEEEDLDPEKQSPLTIQGIATDLASQTLVIVAGSNNVIDVLTEEQQRELQKHISWELADYHYQQRLTRSRQRKPRLLSLPTDNSQALPPIQLFKKLMRWMQTGPVAATTNLFQESQIQPSSHRSLLPPIGGNGIPTQFLGSSLTRLIHLPKNSTAQISNTLRTIRPALRWPSASPFPTGAIALQQFLRKNVSAFIQPGNGENVQTFAKSLGQWNPKLPQFTPPWKTLKGLLNQRFLNQDSGVTIRLGEDPLQTTLKPQPLLGNLTPAVATTLNQAPSGIGDSLTNQQGQDHPPTHTPDWIDTTVTNLGYIKQPLEQVLEWIDQALLWLEKLFSQLLKWLESRLNSP